jgi:hypothetical protein
MVLIIFQLIFFFALIMHSIYSISKTYSSQRGTIDAIVWFLLYDFGDGHMPPLIALLNCRLKDVSTKITQTLPPSTRTQPLLLHEPQGLPHTSPDKVNGINSQRQTIDLSVTSPEVEISKSMAAMGSIRDSDFEMDDIESLSPQLNLALRQELKMFVSLGIRLAVSSGANQVAAAAAAVEEKEGDTGIYNRSGVGGIPGHHRSNDSADGMDDTPLSFTLDERHKFVAYRSTS